MTNLGKIMMNAQNKASENVQNMLKARNVDNNPEMMPPESITNQAYMVGLVSAALSEYHQWLSEEMKKKGLELPELI
ncbi:MAG: hypothetical protein ACI4J7_08820 [Ruminiclostridium sp.]